MIMNKKERQSLLRGKSAAVGIVICFVAVIAAVGTFTFRNYQKEIDEQVAKAEQQAEELTKEIEETTADDIAQPGTDGTDPAGEKPDDTENTELPGQTESQAEENGADAGETQVSGNNTSGVWFSEDSILEWPASGAVIMGYSMDQTVFFQTLEQYQYNPALIVAGETGETISASAAGIVTEIEQTAQTGTTVTLDMGNGYSAVYGQLKEVPVAVGDYVGAGDTVGYLSEPTKYYSVEGPNLYFEVLKDGEPVDPMNYME